jgi:hypothetical protein
MQRQTIHQHQGLTGTERYGATRGTEVAAVMPSYTQGDVEPAPASGVEYGLRNTCVGTRNNSVEKCSAPRANGTDYCIGHLRRFAKEQRQETEELLKLQQSRNELLDAEIQE